LRAGSLKLNKIRMGNLSDNKRKILTLLFGGLSLLMVRTPGKHMKILGDLKEEWAKIEKERIKRDIRELYRSKLISAKPNPDGTLTLVLTDKGKQRLLKYDFEKMRIPRQRWDGKWRIVIFDIPEKQREARDSLRDKLKNLGFHELQRSVFVYPLDCGNEMEFIIEFFNIRKFVRYGTLDSIDNELHLKRIFEKLIRQ